MVCNRGLENGGLTRRALVFAAPSLLVPTVVLAAVATPPRATEGPFYPVRLPSDNDANLVRVDGAVREADGDISMTITPRAESPRPAYDAEIDLVIGG